MWAIKFLSGPKAGHEVLLQKGLVTLGRDPSCQITISSIGISKKHAQIIIKDEYLEIEDLSSSNGTFFNGKKITTQKLTAGDRIAVNDIIFEIVKKTQQVHPYFQPQNYEQNYNQQAQNNSSDFQNSTEQKKDLDFQGVEKKFKGYIHNVVLPGVYKLAEVLEFKWVVGFFLMGFIFLVMTFSSVPLIQILKSSVEQESKNHAESIAITIASLNREHLKSGFHTALSVAYAQRRPGVKKAYIISAVDGRILAPAELSHTYPKKSFIHKARKLDQNTIEKVGLSTVGAVVPIRFYDSTTGENIPIAYSVVLYDMGSLAVGGAKILSLLIQNLFIASLLGLIIFFLLINLIEFPIRSISHQLSEALKNNKSSVISISYQSSILGELCNHINSALNQISLNEVLNSNDNQPEDHITANRQNEMNNLVEIIGFPCLSINLADQTIASVNSNFTEQLEYDGILHNSISEIEHSDLKEHLEMLLEQGQANLEEINFGEITVKNMQIQTTCQFILGAKEPAYAIITFMPAEEEVA